MYKISDKVIIFIEENCVKLMRGIDNRRKNFS